MELPYSVVGKTGAGRLVECRIRGSGWTSLTWETCLHPSAMCAPVHLGAAEIGEYSELNSIELNMYWKLPEATDKATSCNFMSLMLLRSSGWINLWQASPLEI